MPSVSFMGAAIRRREDPRLITGSSTYVDDITLPGLQYMAILRSPYAHARITSIDVSAARTAPEVLAVFTGGDLGGLMLAGGGSETEGAGEVEAERGPEPEMADVTPPHPLLATRVVTHVGEPLAVVIATSPQVAEDALSLIAVEYEPLPVVVDPEAALEPGAPLVHSNRRDNVTERGRMTRGDTDAAFAQAEVVLTQRIVSPRLAPNPMETRGVVAQYERGSGAMTLWTSTQGAHGVRNELVKLLDLPESRVRVIAPEVGGGFGCKAGLYVEDVLAVWCARQLQRPIKWIERRSESLLATNHGRGQVAHISLAATREGRITGLRLRVITDIGAYGQAFLGNITATMITGCYDIPNVDAECLGAFTHKTFLAAYRGAGRPEAAYYLERAMDLLARDLTYRSNRTAAQELP